MTLRSHTQGARPDPYVLETALRLGDSAMARVREVLGEPQGRGRAMLPGDVATRTVWLYYYHQSGPRDVGRTLGFIRLKETRRIFLFVYFREDRYDGYLWFSSL